MRFALTAFVILLSCFPIEKVNAQSVKAFTKAGDEAYKQEDFNAAMHYYSQALTKKQNDPYLNFRYALSAKAFFAFETAEKFLLKTIKLDKEQNYTLAIKELGAVYKQMGNYDEAINQFELYKTNNLSTEEAENINNEINSCNKAKVLLKSPSKYKIKQLRKGINTAYSEFGALKRGDTLYYSSYRFDNKSNKTDPVQKISKELISVKNGRGRVMRKFNAESANTAHTAFSLDGKRIYYNICTSEKGLDIKCRLFYKEKDKRGRWKKTGIALPDTINLKGYTATQPAIGFDSLSEKEVLFFASDRPGGAGGLDIWKVSVEKGKNAFGIPQPLEYVNGPENEITPFFDNRNQTLYFSSDRVQSMGGYDVFKSTLDEKAESIQLLPPINSSYNDVYFTVNSDTGSGYLSSNRPGSFFLDKKHKACCNDLYSFSPLPPEPPTDSLQNEELVETVSETQDEPEIEKEPTTLEDFLPLALYFDNDEPDKRTRRQTTRKNYTETFNKFYPKKSRFQSEFSAVLKEDQKEDAELMVEEFFEDEVEKGHRHLMLFSEILLKRLENGEHVEIFIKGFTSPRAKSDYNLSLGKRRVSCLKNHFFDYKSRIFQQYIDSGHLIISERSFGESSASTEVSDVLEDLANSIYSPAASRERRVEIVEIKVDQN